MTRMFKYVASSIVLLASLPSLALGTPSRGGEASLEAPAIMAVAQADEEAPKKRAPELPPGAKVSMDWTEMDLEEMTKRIAEMTGRNFIMGERLEGKKVTIFAPKMVSRGDAWQIYLSALRTAGYTVVPAGGGTLKIVKKDEAASEPIDTVTGPVVRDGQTYITRLIRLENIPVDDITKALQKLVASEGSMVSYQPNNTLILTDTEANIDRLMKLIEILDVEAPKEIMAVIEVHFADANEVAEIIRQIYGDESSSRSRASTSRTSTARNRRSRRSQASGAATTDVEAGASISKIIPDERTNSIIILATEKAVVDIRELVAKLDYEVDPLLKSDIHVVFLEHAAAEELSNTLSNLTSDAGRGGRSTTRTSGSSRNRQAAASGDNTVATFEGGVKVTADESTNALVITASYNDYIILKRVIDKLDVRRRQVFVEGVILEVTQDRTNALGLSYHGGLPIGSNGTSFIGTRGSQSLIPPLTDTTALAGLALGVFGQAIELALPDGTGGTTSLSIPAFGVFLQALQTDQEINILSTPQIMTLNNKEAEIVVGANVPFLAGSTVTGTGLQTLNITREDTGLKLKVKPQVNQGDEVTLEIFQEITEVVATTADSPTGPTTTKRTATTTVSVPDNQTVVIGGLISTKYTNAERKVPLLGDIPLIGVLFRRQDRTETKSNLLIFLTPHVIDSPEDLQDVYRIKMLQRQEFIRRFYGKSREEQLAEFNDLLQYSMNLPGYESVYPDRPPPDHGPSTISSDVSEELVPRYGSYRGSFAGPGPEDDDFNDEAAPMDEPAQDAQDDVIDDDDGFDDEGFDDGGIDDFDEGFDDGEEEDIEAQTP